MTQSILIIVKIAAHNEPLLKGLLATLRLLMTILSHIQKMELRRFLSTKYMRFPFLLLPLINCMSLTNLHFRRTLFLFYPWVVLIHTSLFFPILIPTCAQSAGVTIITHGFNSGTTGWMSNWSSVILPRVPIISGQSSITQYTIYATAEGMFDPVSVTLGPRIGDQPVTTMNCEVVILLDWSAIDVHMATTGRDTTTVAEAVVEKILDPIFFPDLTGHLITEMPIHVIGHSRGGSLVCELARLLGERGIWIDHLTTLDPHPLQGGFKSGDQLSGLSDTKFNLNDALPQIYTNTLFADNYWREGEGAIPNGRLIEGAYNRNVGDLDGGYALTSGGDHSDTHLWYFGTIDIQTPTSNGDGIPITQAMRDYWWNSLEEKGFKTGFYFNRIAAWEWGPTDPRLAVSVRDGLHTALGGDGHRDVLTLSPSPQWPNVCIQEVGDGGSMFQVESNIPITYLAQDGDGSMSVTLMKDSDTNPYNDPPPTVIRATEEYNDLTGSFDILPRPWETGISDVGDWFVLAKGSDEERTRYFYWPKRITINASPTPTPQPSENEKWKIYR